MFAHIAGIPIEETALGLGPVVLTVGGIASLRLRERLFHRRGRMQRDADGAAARRQR
jgi:hypothetical protein